MNIDNTKRFSDRVSNYIKYRPGYPEEIISFLEETTGLTQQSLIADIGSGTGKLSEIFLDNGYNLYGVEPNDEMREAAEAEFQDNPHFKSINGTAENTTLPSDSFSHIIAGQAFHWFDPVLCKTEFQKILKPGGWAILIWNERDVDSPFLEDYESFLLKHAIRYAEVVHRNIDEKVLSTFYEPFSYKIKSTPSYQLFDFEGTLGRYQSSSYAFKEGDNEFPAAKEALKVLFDNYQQDGLIKMEYQTNIYYGQLK